MGKRLVKLMLSGVAGLAREMITLGYLYDAKLPARTVPRVLQKTGAY